MATTEEAWKLQEEWGRSRLVDADARCLLDLRRRVEALEQRALTAPEPSAAEPAPAADRPLWEVMQQAWRDPESIEFSIAHRYAAEIDAVADWLAAREYCGAASALRIEARRAREGQ